MDIREFLETSYTAYHAVGNAEERLVGEGFVELDPGAEWEIKEGGKYYCKVNGSAIFAIRIGKADGDLTIACAHTDSPCLKVKGKALLDSPEGKRINVEKYGGLILYSMLDIPLRIAGRVLVRTERGVESRLVKSDFSVNIPSLCIHHNPDVNDKFALNVQSDMLPLLGDAEDVYTAIGVPDALDADLYVVPDVKPYLSGKEGKYLVSPRIDNLTSVYACIEGIVTAEPAGIAVAACFDNEEIGSGTKQGAESAFLPELLHRVMTALGRDEASYAKARRDGLVLSVDNGHAVHPAHPEKSDVAEKVYFNGGIVIKHHANYATDGLSSAKIKAILLDAGIPNQDYYNRSDLRCGGTLGLLVAKQLVMSVADIGLAQLAMHSAVETVGSEDIARMTGCIRALFAASKENRL